MGRQATSQTSECLNLGIAGTVRPHALMMIDRNTALTLPIVFLSPIGSLFTLAGFCLGKVPPFEKADFVPFVWAFEFCHLCFVHAAFDCAFVA